MHLAIYSFAVLLFALFCVLVVASSRAAFILHSQFPDVWEAEGKPERWLYLNRMPSHAHFFRFLDERRYLATGSASFARVCGAIRVGWYAFFVLFICAFAGAFALAFFGAAA